MVKGEEFLEVCRRGDVKAVRRLLDGWHGFKYAMKILLRPNSSCVLKNHVDNNGMNGFMYACENGHKEVVELLVTQYNCDVNHFNNDGRNGFMSACENGHKEVVELLVTQYNCDVNHANNNGRNGFMYACKNGHKEVVELLVTKSNCDVNHVDNDVWNCYNGFMWACKNGHKEVVELLVTKSNCDVRFMNKSNKTGFDLARNREIRLLILQVPYYFSFSFLLFDFILFYQQLF